MPDITVPKAFKGLFSPKRYKVYYGGRGGAKSYNFAIALLVMGMSRKMRILCARELQGSIADSVHKLLSDIVDQYELGTFYEVQKATILGKNGTEFIFKGLKHNSTEIKSTEGVDVCWVEEAEKVSDSSWEILIPTIRKDGSEIWCSFNPKNPTDPTYRRMVLEADENFHVQKVSYLDNPFFPETLEIERRRLQSSDPVAYKHIWEGEFDERFTGFVYAEILKQAAEANRICEIPRDDVSDVITAWDLGHADSTAIWFAQKKGLEVRVIDYYENNFEPLEHYAQVIKDKGYRYTCHYLPHDGNHERLGARGSIKSQLREMGLHCQTLPTTKLEAGINLTRDLLKSAYIDKNKCADGLHALRNYQYEYDDNKGMFKQKPKHDWSSHASDAMRYLAMALKEQKTTAEHEYIDPFKYIQGYGYSG